MEMFPGGTTERKLKSFLFFCVNCGECCLFCRCENLANAPKLPAKTLVRSCYRYIFFGCEKLDSITMLATDISASSCLTEWVSGVASTGTFTKAAEMTLLQTGVNGIPEGWTVVDYEDPAN